MEQMNFNLVVCLQIVIKTKQNLKKLVCLFQLVECRLCTFSSETNSEAICVDFSKLEHFFSERTEAI